jgi:hypothetical protein
LNQKVFARKTQVRKLDKDLSQTFFDTNHLMGNAKAAYHYGLMLGDTCLAAMSWSKSRVFTDKQVYYRSYELIRFANQCEITVIGGFTKLLQHFLASHHPAHIMTYTDNDWGSASTFENLGFQRFGSTQNLNFFVNPKTHERKYKLDEKDLNHYTIQGTNSGNTKWIIDFLTS